MLKDSLAGEPQVSRTLPHVLERLTPRVTRHVINHDSSTLTSDNMSRYDEVYLKTLHIQRRFAIVIRHLKHVAEDSSQIHGKKYTR